MKKWTVILTLSALIAIVLLPNIASAQSALPDQIQVVPEQQTPETPATPTEPQTPTTPETPSTPQTPTTPSTPSTPQTPENPTTPSQPQTPTPQQPSNPEASKPDENPGQATEEGDVESETVENVSNTASARKTLAFTGGNSLFYGSLGLLTIIIGLAFLLSALVEPSDNAHSDKV